MKVKNKEVKEQAKLQDSFKMILGKDNIAKGIKTIQLQGKKFDKLIHQIAVSTLNHIELHGDITLALNLLEAMPKHSRKQALKAWMLAFGKLKEEEIELKAEDGKTSKAKKIVYDGTKLNMIEDAIVHPFYDFIKEKEEVVYDHAWFIKTVKTLITKASKNKDLKDQVFVLEGLLPAKDKVQQQA